MKLFSQLCILSLLIALARTDSIALNEDNWDDMLEGEWMVEFYAPWCPACKALQPIWNDFATWSDDLGIQIAHVDVTKSPGLSGRFMVTALPTIYHVSDGVFRQYRGPRDKDHFLSFVEEKKWLQAEEVPAWKSPGSYQMAVVAQFFKLSMKLRAVHTILVQDYGLPEWGSYVIFALATILTGALIGLLLVCVIDFFFPPKAHQATTVLASHIRDNEEDLPEENETEEEGSQDEASDSQAEDGSQEEDAASSQTDEEVEADQVKEAEQEKEEVEEVGGDEQVEEEENKEVEATAGARKRRTRRAD